MFDRMRYRKRQVRSDRQTRCDILYLTFNRLAYTRTTLPALLDSVGDLGSVTVVDNHSTDGTARYLESLDHPALRAVMFNRLNRGLVKPTREFWRDSRAEFVGKIDNDILVPRDWLEKLVAAHEGFAGLGIVGFCHFRRDDYDKTVVAAQMERFDGVYLRRQPWIGGNYLARRSVLMANPDYRSSWKGLRRRILQGFNSYQQRLAGRGYVNGYLADAQGRLLHWTHLDDPREPRFLPESAAASTRRLGPDRIVEWYRRDAKALLEEYRPPVHTPSRPS